MLANCCLDSVSNIDFEAISAINVFTGLKVPVSKKERKTDMYKAWEDQRRIDKA